MRFFLPLLLLFLLSLNLNGQGIQLHQLSQTPLVFGSQDAAISTYEGSLDVLNSGIVRCGTGCLNKPASYGDGWVTSKRDAVTGWRYQHYEEDRGFGRIARRVGLNAIWLDWEQFYDPSNPNNDPSPTNEGILSVGAGDANSSTVNSNTAGSPAITFSGGANTTITESGDTITISSTGSAPELFTGVTDFSSFYFGPNTHRGIRQLTGTTESFTGTSQAAIDKYANYMTAYNSANGDYTYLSTSVDGIYSETNKLIYFGGPRFVATGTGSELEIVSGAIKFTSTAATDFTVQGPPATFKGVQYFADYSANYTDRSLVDKGYLQASIAAGIGDNLGNHIMTDTLVTFANPIIAYSGGGGTELTLGTSSIRIRDYDYPADLIGMNIYPHMIAFKTRVAETMPYSTGYTNLFFKDELIGGVYKTRPYFRSRADDATQGRTAPGPDLRILTEGDNFVLSDYLDADLSITNNASTEELAFSVANIQPNSVYKVEVFLLTSGDNAGDIKLYFRRGTGLTSAILKISSNLGNTSSAPVLLDGTVTIQTTVAADGRAVFFSGVLQTEAEGGTFEINMTQSVSNAIASVLVKNSYVVLTKLN